MKDLTKKAAMAVCSLAFIGLAAGQAQAISITVTQVDPVNQDAVNALIGDDGIILEHFETFGDNDMGWYGGDGTGPDVIASSLYTAVGTFTAGGLAGTGSSSYNASHPGVAPDTPYFELRDYDANGRYDVTDVPPGDQFTNYLDTSDITELTLDLTTAPQAFNNLFFFITDPSDIWADTTTGARDSSNNDATTIFGDNPIEYQQNNASLWFVEIDGEGDTIASINWTITAHDDGTPYTDDGVGLDNFGTRCESCPEPSTALLLGAGLLPLVGLRRRKKK